MSEFHRLECDCERCDLLHAAYDEGVQDSMLRAAQLERILRDLIDTLRAEGAGSPVDPWIRRSALGIMADEAGVRLAGVARPDE